jgi:GNAT superfamily N-acetyltransferase
MTLRTLTSSADPAFGGLLALYHEAFPANERQSDERMAERLDTGHSEFQVGEIEGSVALMAVTYPLPGLPFDFLDYLAVDSRFRGQGLGGAFFRALAPGLKERQRRLVLEVEDPDYGENREQRLRRVAFYRDNGARVLYNTPYLLPPLSGDLPTEMWLMVFPATAGESFEKAQIQQLMRTLYTAVYQRESNDPLLDRFLPFLPDPVTTD